MIDTLKLSETQILAVTLYGEARSEPVEGVIAVASVIRNRVNADLGNDGKADWWGEGFKGVCLARRQFSCWAPEGGPGNFAKVEALVTKLSAGDAVTDARYIECAWIATGVIKGWCRDTVKGATHYHTVQMIPRPSWAQALVPVTQVRNHLFYAMPVKKVA